MRSLALVMLVALPAAAETGYPDSIPNGRTQVPSCKNCHNSRTGGIGAGWNVFGDYLYQLNGCDPEDQPCADVLAEAGNFVFWNATICAEDTDGDGFTNGDELGDPDCVWQEGLDPASDELISYPGDAESTPETVGQEGEGEATDTGQPGCSGSEARAVPWGVLALVAVIGRRRSAFR